MRCGCPQCGTYMIQSEHGLESGCVCPACFNRCSACMGTEQPPLRIAELQQRITELQFDEISDYDDEVYNTAADKEKLW